MIRFGESVLTHRAIPLISNFFLFFFLFIQIMLLFDSILTMNRLHGHRTKEKILLKVADITLISLVDEVLPNMEIQVLEKNLNLERMGIANQMR